MIRHTLATLAAVALLASMAGAATAAPSGPRLALVKWGSSLELVSIASDGGRSEVLSQGSERQPFGGPAPFQAPSWSPDGEQIVFSGYGRSGKLALFVMSSDGTALRALPGTRKATHPVFSADGRTLAFARTRIVEPKIDFEDPLKSLEKDRFSGTTAWLLDLADGSQRQLTRWRDGLHNTPSSFSPDGSFLAMSRASQRGIEAVALPLAGRGRVRILAREAEEPVYSPDGSRIAFASYRDRNTTAGFDGPVRVSELYVKSLQDGRLRRITNTTELPESMPSWDPSGERLAYIQSSEAESFGFGNVVMQVNQDGTCPQRVFGRPVKRSSRGGAALFGPTWQPGPGREAGRIEC